MQDKGKFSVKKILVSQIFVIVGLFVLIFFFVTLSKEFLRGYEVNKELDNLKSEILTLEDQNSNFGDIIEYLKTSDFAEKEARKRFNYKKPGESMVVIETANLGETTPNLSAENDYIDDNLQTNNKEISNPEKWWDYYFGKKM